MLLTEQMIDQIGKESLPGADCPMTLLEVERQAGDSQKARGNLGPRDSILHQTVSRLPVANQVFLGPWTS